MKSIRVGIIRCDLHALYYGALMARHDPALLRDPEIAMGAHFYFYTHYRNTDQLMVPTVGGGRITKVWDENAVKAKNMSRVFLGKPKICDTFEEVSDDVDLVFVADCNLDGSDHLKLSAPGIRKGMPTFIDKPFACEVKDAVAMVRLAKKHRTPIMSLSILRSVPHATRFSRRFDELDGVHFGLVKGGWSTLAGQIHAISLAQNIFGNGVKSVSCMGPDPLAYIHLDYGDTPDRPEAGVMLNCRSGPTTHASFYASAYGPGGAIHSPPIGDFEFPWGATRNLELAKQMVKTAKPPVPYDDMIENIAVATAARRAQKTGKSVRLRQVWRQRKNSSLT